MGKGEEGDEIREMEGSRGNKRRESRKNKVKLGMTSRECECKWGEVGQMIRNEDE